MKPMTSVMMFAGTIALVRPFTILCKRGIQMVAPQGQMWRCATTWLTTCGGGGMGSSTHQSLFAFCCPANCTVLMVLTFLTMLRNIPVNCVFVFNVLII